MNRILFAAARGARVQVLGKNINEFWWNTLDFSKMHSHDYRIHPEDAHLEYGPISTELRKEALSEFWSARWIVADAFVQDYISDYDADVIHNFTDSRTFLLLLSEALADEGM